MHRVVIAIALTLCVYAAPTLAGWIEEREDGTTVIHVKVWNLPAHISNDPASSADADAIRKFRERFPEIFEKKYREKYKANPEKYGDYKWDRVEIELHSAVGISLLNQESDLLAIAGDLANDVMYVNFRMADTYIQNSFLYPLDKPEDGYLSSMTPEEIEERIHPKIWPVVHRKGPEGNTNVWAMPYGRGLGRVVLYRKDLFDEYNVPRPTNDWTWDDFMAACKAITDPEKGRYGTAFFAGLHEAWHWMAYLWSAGGEAMARDPVTDEWRCVFDTREAAVALDYYIRLCSEKWVDEKGIIRRGYAVRDPNYHQTYWLPGKVGMILGYTDRLTLSQINPENTGIAPVPIGPTGLRGAELNSRMFGLYSQIKHPAIRDAGWEYIYFYDSDEALAIKTAIMVEAGLGPFLHPRLLRKFGYEDVIRLAPKGWEEIFDIIDETGRPEPYGRNSNLAYNMMTFPIHEADQLLLDGELPEEQEARLDVLQDILRKYTAKANEEMIGIITPEERSKRDLSAYVVIAFIVLAFCYGYRHISKAFAPPEGWSAKGLKWGFVKYRWAYFLLLPALLTILVWQYYPLLRGASMAFQDYRIVGDSAWIGVRNFGDLLWNPDWWKSVWYALQYCLLVVAFTFLPPIILAMLLQEVPKGRLFFRTIYYLPAVITGLVVVILWKQFYDPSDYGVLNTIVMQIPAIGLIGIGFVCLAVCILFANRLYYHEKRLPGNLSMLAGLGLLVTFIGLAWPILVHREETLSEALPYIFSRLFEGAREPFRWLGDTRTAMICCVIPMVWAGIGPNCLIYLAALKGVPEELYEAADVDGASSTEKVLFIVFPILKPLILINFISVFIASIYGASANILAMTGGAKNTMVADLHIFYRAFIYLDFGSATAMAWVLALLLIGFTMYQLRILSRLEFRAGGAKE
jgi:ABC-type sugar transport system permease subunit/ABC-type glycerol-3-phosphate transport system substrate-binding protein